jgi:hypothetical protein
LSRIIRFPVVRISIHHPLALELVIGDALHIVLGQASADFGEGAKVDVDVWAIFLDEGLSEDEVDVGLAVFLAGRQSSS